MYFEYFAVPWSASCTSYAPTRVSTGLPADGVVMSPSIVIVFGSLTCEIFCGHLTELNRLHRTYGKRAAFLFVSVTEAGHAIDGLEFLLEGRAPGRPSLARGNERSRWTLKERRSHLARGIAKMKLTMPGVIDVDGVHLSFRPNRVRQIPREVSSTCA